MAVDQAPEAEIAAVGPRGGDAHPARGRPRQGARGPDQPRGGPPCHRLSARLIAFGYRGIGRSGRSRRQWTSTSQRFSRAWSRRRPPTSTSPPGFPPAMRDKGKIVPMEGFPVAHRPGDPRGRLQHPQRRPAQALREPQAARLRLRDPGRRPLPRQLLLPARLGQRRLPPRPAGDPGARLARRAAGPARADRANRAASSSSPARPARASRRPWRR